MEKETKQIDQALEKIGMGGDKAGKIIRSILTFIRNKVYLIGAVLIFGLLTFIASFGHGLLNRGDKN